MADVAAASGSLYSKSPLDTLVRQSSHRPHHTAQLQPVRPGGLGNHDRDPSSPLLHTRFRTSASTAMSTDNSFVDFQDDSVTSQDTTRNRDDDSVYSNISGSPGYSTEFDIPMLPYVVDALDHQSPSFSMSSANPSFPRTKPELERQSWASPGSEDTVRIETYRRSTDTIRDTWRSSRGIDPFSFQSYESPQTQIPKVVFSSHVSTNSNPPFHDLQPSQSPRFRSVTTPRPSATQYSVTNFSRPIRPSPVHEVDGKLDVLDREESSKQMQPLLALSQRHHKDHVIQENPRSPFQQHGQQRSSPAALYPSTYPYERPDIRWSESTTSAVSRSLSANAVRLGTQELTSNSHSPQTTNITRSVSATVVASLASAYIRIPNSPPSPRPTSRASLYSTYSFYQLPDGSRASSPASLASNLTVDGDDAKVNSTRSSPPFHNPSQPAPLPSSNPSTKAVDYLSLGIQYHEANRLAESASCFERAATVDGGCGVGMLMWGLSLRHAWGTAKDEKAAFRWLRRAAEAAVGDLEAAREGREQKAIKTELVLAIYEVGQCFFHGWGVAQDKKMAVSYFQVAARLGDGDAQQELGYCLANGKGCKKDLKEAAKWYRAAAAQGASTVGLAWIYKPKYT